MKWVPHNYMKRAVKFLLERDGAALFADPGMGKTSITYAVLSFMKKAGVLQGAVVVAPRRPANMVWRQERDKWENFHDLSVAVLHGAGKELLVDEPHDVYVVTYDGFKWLAEQGHLRSWFRKKRINVLVLDELSKVKHKNNGRASIINKWSHRFEKRIGLTGSPASNGLLDLFGQAYALDGGKLFGEHITKFRHSFFSPVGSGMYPTWVPKPDAEDLIFARMRGIAMRLDADDYLEMPTLIENRIKLELPPKERKWYDEMEKEFFTNLEDQGGLVTAVSAAASMMKCRQLTSGAVYEDKVDPLTGMPRAGKRQWNLVHDLKLEAVQDLVEELQGQQLLLGIEFDHERERLLKVFGKDTPCIVGGTSDKRAQMYGDAWNAGDIPLLIGHPASMGHGLNFQDSHAYNVAWFSGTWDYELYDQFIRRLRRQGNKAKRLFVHQFVFDDTVDEAVFAAMKRKRNVQNALFEALKTYRRKKHGSVHPSR